MRTHNIPPFYRKIKEILIMPPDLTLLSTLTGLNCPCLEQIFMVPKVFEPLKFYCIFLVLEIALVDGGNEIIHTHKRKVMYPRPLKDEARGPMPRRHG